MMKQPELGEKIVALRLAQGLTQAELADKCNISVRTVQRLEATEVTPRSYTIKVVLDALDYGDHSSSDNTSIGLGKMLILMDKWRAQLLKLIKELFDFKTNKMKKISFITVFSCLVIAGVFFINNNSNAQSIASAKKYIEESGQKQLQWFNEKEIGKILASYDDNACILSLGCGKQLIKGYYEYGMNSGMKIKEVNVNSISVSKNMAVEKGEALLVLSSGEELSTSYIIEWQYKNKKWMIVNELSANQILPEIFSEGDGE